MPGGLLPGVGQGLHQVAQRLLVGEDEHDPVAHSALLVNLENNQNAELYLVGRAVPWRRGYVNTFLRAFESNKLQR